MAEQHKLVEIPYSRKLSRPITFALFAIFESRENIIREIINNTLQMAE